MEYKFTADNFESEVLKSEVPVLVDFYADWCGPCKMMAPVIAQLAEKYEGKVKVGKCNIDEEDGLARVHRVMNIPNMKVFVKGEVVGNIVGAVSQDVLEAELKKVLQRNRKRSGRFSYRGTALYAQDGIFIIMAVCWWAAGRRKSRWSF